MRSLATFAAVLAFGFFGVATGCSPSAGDSKPQEEPKPATKPAEPTPGAGAKESLLPPKPPEATPAIAGLPVLSGDKAKDKAAVIAALAKLKTEWTATEAELEKLTKSGQVVKPDPARLEALKGKNELHKRTADELEKMLQKLTS